MAHVDMREVIADLCDADEMTRRAAVGMDYLAANVTVDDLLRWHSDQLADEPPDSAALDARR